MSRLEARQLALQHDIAESLLAGAWQRGRSARHGMGRGGASSAWQQSGCLVK